MSHKSEPLWKSYLLEGMEVKKINLILNTIRGWFSNLPLHEKEVSRLKLGKNVEVCYYLISIPKLLSGVCSRDNEYATFIMDEILSLELLTDDVIKRFFWKYTENTYFSNIREGSGNVNLKMELLLFFLQSFGYRQVEKLSKLYLDPNYQNYKGETFLHIIFRKKNDHIVARLMSPKFILEILKQIEDINLKNDEGESYLTLLSKNILMAGIIIPAIRDLGGNINITDSEGNTPLIIAAKNNKFKNVKILLKNGADSSIKGENGSTFIDFLTGMNVEQEKYISEYFLDLERKKGNIKGAINREEEK